MNFPRRGETILVNGKQVHVHSVGHGAPVLLLHGCGSLGEEILSAFPRTRLIRWIAPDRPGYGYSDMPEHSMSPQHQADWIADLLDTMGIAECAVVAHSLSSGAALAFASRYRSRISRLVLLSPFCRPTPHAPMLWLRLATLPILGSPVRRRLLPALAPYVGPRKLARLMKPARVPSWLKRFPYEHAARSSAIKTMAAELRSFNAGMVKAERELGFIEAETSIIYGTADRTAPFAWHIEWLCSRLASASLHPVDGAGHAPHHAAPLAVHRLVSQSVVYDVHQRRRSTEPQPIQRRPIEVPAPR